MSQDNLKRSLPRNFTFDGENKAEVLRNFYTMMKQHGISPTVVHYLPKVTDSGNAAEGDWADKVAPFLDETDGAVGLQDNQLPFLRFFPWSRSEHPSSAAILNYLTQMTRVYKDHGWHKKAYVYILDETTKRSEELQAERYARLAHKASARSGYRIKFLLTDDPRPHSPRRRQDGQHVPLRRRRHLDAALLLLLRAHPGGARAPEGRQGDLVVLLRQRLRAQDPVLRHRQAAHRLARLGLADGEVERRRPPQLGLQPLGQADDRQRLARPVPQPALADQGAPAQQRRHLPRLPGLLPALRARPARRRRRSRRCASRRCATASRSASTCASPRRCRAAGPRRPPS